jgi:hypothetical protein
MKILIRVYVLVAGPLNTTPPVSGKIISSVVDSSGQRTGKAIPHTYGRSGLIPALHSLSFASRLFCIFYIKIPRWTLVFLWRSFLLCRRYPTLSPYLVPHLFMRCFKITMEISNNPFVLDKSIIAILQRIFSQEKHMNTSNGICLLCHATLFLYTVLLVLDQVQNKVMETRSGSWQYLYIIRMIFMKREKNHEQSFSKVGLTRRKPDCGVYASLGWLVQPVGSGKICWRRETKWHIGRGDARWAACKMYLSTLCPIGRGR